NPHRLALATVEVAAPPAAVKARGPETVPAELAGAVRPGERGHDQVAPLHLAHLAADFLDDADELVAHPAPLRVGLHRLVGPEIAAADAGPRDGEERVGGLDEPGVRNRLHPDVAGAIHDGRSHAGAPSAPRWYAWSLTCSI